MSSPYARYRAFFREPDVVRLLATFFVARMPIGMLSLALLMHLREITQSFAIAGSIVGAELVAMAVAAPVQGRLVDRFGPAGVLRVTGVVQPLALLALLAADHLGFTPAVMMVVGIVAGAFVPPVAVLTRTLWRYRFHDDRRRTAFALDAVLIELNYTLGPALIALLLATANARVAFAATIAFAAVAAPLFLGSPARRYWQQAAYVEGPLLGPLTEPQLLRVLLASFALTCGLGLLEVSYPGFAARVGQPPAGGLLIAVNSLGSAVGGIAYGGLHPRMPLPRQVRALLALLALPVALHAFVADIIWMVPLAFVAGLLIAPSFAIFSMLVSQHAPARHATEAFTWLTTGIVAGIGAGMAAGGWLIELRGPAFAFAASAICILGGALVALAVRAPEATGSELRT